MGLTLLYDLTWTDVTYVLGQTLTPHSRTQALGEATAFGYGLNVRQVEKGNIK